MLSVGLPAGFHPTAAVNTQYGAQRKRMVAFMTDAVETSSRYLTLDIWAAAGLKAYGARDKLIALGTSPALGAYHSADDNFVFNHVNTAAYNNTSDLQAVSLLMSRSWAAFVHDLDPNGHGRKLCIPHHALLSTYKFADRSRSVWLSRLACLEHQ
jgi:carboxylesterase type B